MVAVQLPSPTRDSERALRSMWGPRVEDARWLWSDRVLDLITARVGETRGEVAEGLLSMKSQQRYLLLEQRCQTRRVAVFAAVDQLLAREVALKVLREDSDEQQCWQLLAEMQAMTRFDHPNLVRALDFGVHDGWPYFVMELCDGDLEWWGEGKSWRELLARLIEAGRGLEIIHRAGLVHGDIKPENIMVLNGKAKLGDLGLAGPPGLSTRIRGTVGYLAPEVAEGSRHFASDVFSFACTVWGTLFEQLPFDGQAPAADTSAAAFVQIERARGQRLDLRAARASGLPSSLVAALRPALAAEPGDRPSLAELLAELEAVLVGVRRWFRLCPRRDWARRK